MLFQSARRLFPSPIRVERQGWLVPAGLKMSMPRDNDAVEIHRKGMSSHAGACAGGKAGGHSALRLVHDSPAASKRVGTDNSKSLRAFLNRHFAGAADSWRSVHCGKRKSIEVTRGRFPSVPQNQRGAEGMDKLLIDLRPPVLPEVSLSVLTGGCGHFP